MADPVAGVLTTGFDRLVRGGLRGVWLRGRLPAGPFVWAANHHSWWDPFVAAALLRHARRTACLVMLQDNIQWYAFTRRLGVFGSGEVRTGLRYLAEGRALVVYPEGGLRPAGPPGPLADGAAWYAHRAGVPLAAVAVRVVLRGQQFPEAYVSIRSLGSAVPTAASGLASPVSGGASSAAATAGDVGVLTGVLARTLRDELSTMDLELAMADPRTGPTGFRLVLPGRRSWDERIDALGRRLPWRS
ncbi:lysophospholipid acyltransferase family protein [Hamadaea sp. NPDC051192]|uniref:lysophospholipid acyltransferase family protein n=1 Tax=Hamadaea sp. NPDC051192 TaxID=3154940 RepID=UPI00343DD4F1